MKDFVHCIRSNFVQTNQEDYEDNEPNEPEFNFAEELAGIVTVGRFGHTASSFAAESCCWGMIQRADVGFTGPTLTVGGGLLRQRNNNEFSFHSQQKFWQPTKG